VGFPVWYPSGFPFNLPVVVSWIVTLVGVLGTAPGRVLLEHPAGFPVGVPEEPHGCYGSTGGNPKVGKHWGPLEGLPWSGYPRSSNLDGLAWRRSPNRATGKAHEMVILDGLPGGVNCKDPPVDSLAKVLCGGPEGDSLRRSPWGVPIGGPLRRPQEGVPGVGPLEKDSCRRGERGEICTGFWLESPKGGDHL
jgi:hypothetical protein